MSQPLAAQSYWVVIPAYNEGATVRDVAIRARQHCANVIVVDDGSIDNTPERLAGLNITVLRNELNSGKAHSLWRGFQHALAQGAVGVLTLDGDGQHAPEEIPSFIAATLNSPEALLIGARRPIQRKASRWRYFANRIADFWISWAAGRPIEDSQSGFRFYPARLLRDLTLKHGRKQSFVFESEILIEAARRGVRFLFVPIGVTPRLDPRTSHFRPVADILHITKMVGLKLLTRGLYPPGFYRAFIRRRHLYKMSEQTMVKPKTVMSNGHTETVPAPYRRHRTYGLNSLLR
jgi:glycosyltransferase involved in cell wall biosynthesis